MQTNPFQLKVHQIPLLPHKQYPPSEIFVLFERHNGKKSLQINKRLLKIAFILESINIILYGKTMHYQQENKI